MKKIIFLLSFICLLALNAKSQTSLSLHNALGSTLLTDTVTNTGTGLVQADASRMRGNTTSIQFNATKSSGIVAGTIALHGSNDGTNYASISSTTFTATDVASQSGVWQLTGSPLKHYRVTWTGAGTMAATIKATVWTNQDR